MSSATTLRPAVDQPQRPAPGPVRPHDAPGGRRGVRATLAGLTALAGLVAVAPAFGATATDALHDPGFTLVAAGAAALVTGVGVGLAVATRCSRTSRLAIEVAALAGYLLLVVAPGAAIAQGPRRLLTGALPLDRSGPELAAVAAGLGLAAIAAVEPALRRPGPALPLLGPVLAVAAGCAVAAPDGPPVGWLAVVLVPLVVLAYLLAEGERRAALRTATGTEPAASRPGGLLAVLLALAVVALTGVVAGRAVDGPPAAARDLADQPVTPSQTTSPLALFPALRTGRLSLQLTVAGDSLPDRLRYATLDTFDGTFWSSSAVYRRAGRTLPAGPAGPPTREVTHRIHVVEPGPLGWLLSQGRPVTVSVAGLGVDAGTGDVVLPADRPLPRDYTIRSLVPTYSDDDLANAVPAPAPAGTGTLVPADLSAAAVAAVDGGYGYPALATLASWFAADGGFTLDTGEQAPAGHGLYQIRQLLRDRHGTAEQYASAFAVLARALGYDTRVAVGFRVRAGGSQGSGGQGSEDQGSVSGKDVDAWPEVRFAGLGWVAFAPTPQTAGSPPAPKPTPSPSTAGQDSAPTDPGPGGGSAGGPANGAGHRGSTPWLALAVAAGGLLVGLGALGPGAVLLRRWRRRRAPTPRARVAGAWRDALATLRAAGVAVPRAASSGAIAAAVTRRFDDVTGALAARLGVVHDRVAYGPVDPSTADSDDAWRVADELRAAVRGRLPHLRRLRVVLVAVPGRGVGARPSPGARSARRRV